MASNYFFSALVIFSNSAKNNIVEFGGFSPTQSLFGSYPSNWNRAQVAETAEERMQDSLLKTDARTKGSAASRL